VPAPTSLWSGSRSAASDSACQIGAKCALLGLQCPILRVCRYLVEVAHVALVPGDAFGAPDCVRISYAASLQTLEEAMNRITAALDPGVFTRNQ
jgi:aspartate/methionine/tyrosine aminotransferase